MTDYTPAEVRMMLARFELTGAAFDPEEIADDLRARSALNDELDALVAAEAPPDPTAFDPRWRDS